MYDMNRRTTLSLNGIVNQLNTNVKIDGLN